MSATRVAAVAAGQWLAARADESTSASGSASASSSGGAHGGLSVGTNPAFKIVGVSLAIGSGLFIGVSFVIKKKGLLSSTEKSGADLGDGHAYLKSPMWWTGMILMVIGEILNFVAYAFTVAILVTPMGSISVVVAAILSHFILKETLTFFGWIGCTLCILGSVVLALNAPDQQTTRTIPEFMKLFISPGFLVWAGICIAASLVLVFYVAPRWGKKNMLPYISVCSLIGGISVSCTQGLGASIITSIQGENQVKHWFFWFLFVFVVVTLLIEINYLNKALALFNTSMVVPVYFCYFTSATMITSFILYQGLKASAVQLVTMVLGFLVTCLGITLLQMSKVDPKKLQGLDRRTTMLLQASRQHTEASEKGDVAAAEEPGMDALRGGFGAVGSIIRARSVSRRLSRSRSHSSGAHGFGTAMAMHNTQGLGHLPRYQLSDNPMPDDGETIALSPQVTGRSRQSTLKFDNNDLVHQYGYGAEHATHEMRPHETRRHGSGFDLAHMESLADIRESAELPEGARAAALSAGASAEKPSSKSPSPRFPSPEPTGNPYLHPISPVDHRHHQPERKTSFSTLFRNIAGGFDGDNSDEGRGQAADPPTALQPDDMKRGGAHRGVRDYPHLSKGEATTEREERTALVGAAANNDELDIGLAPLIGPITSNDSVSDPTGRTYLNASPEDMTPSVEHDRASLGASAPAPAPPPAGGETVARTSSRPMGPRASSKLPFPR